MVYGLTYSKYNSHLAVDTQVDCFSKKPKKVVNLCLIWRRKVLISAFLYRFSYQVIRKMSILGVVTHLLLVLEIFDCKLFLLFVVEIVLNGNLEKRIPVQVLLSSDWENLILRVITHLFLGLDIFGYKLIFPHLRQLRDLLILWLRVIISIWGWLRGCWYFG